MVSVWSTIYFALAASFIRRWLDEDTGDGEARELPPVTLLRPVKPGVPELREKLRLLAGAMRAGDQLVLGADAGSAELAVCDSVRREFQDRCVEVVACEAGAAMNPKISKLVQMAQVARHEHQILSDSEARIDADWLTAFRREWLASGADVLTAGYRFVGQSSWPQRLDAAAALLTLWPGLAMVRQFGTVRFTLGACTGFRVGDIAAIGGWAVVGGDLAEDHRLGAKLASRGRRMRLSRHVVNLEADPMSWRGYWRHQRRVALTYRVANPAGFAGMILTHGVAASLLLGFLAKGASGAVLSIAFVALRCLFAAQIARRVQFQVKWLPAVVIVAGLVETVCWLLGWVTRRTWWAGRWWQVSGSGKLQYWEES